MTRSTETVRIRVEYRSDGRFYVSSDDVPGLFLWGSDFEELMEDIAPTIKDLYKFNRGMDVEVKEGLISKFVSWMFIRLFRASRGSYKKYSIGGQHLTGAHG